MTIDFAQLQPFTLAGSGSAIGDTSLVLTNMLTIEGALVTMAIFGSIGFGTIQPDALSFEEQISFTGVTQNGNGTATLTGVKHVAFVTPYTQTPGMTVAHPGGSVFVISNTSGFYDEFLTKINAETITSVKTFDVATGRPKLSADVDTAVDAEFLDYGQAARMASAGAANASTTIKGIVQEATQAQVDAKTATGSTGALLFANTANLRASKYNDYVVSIGAANNYTITPTPAVTSYVAGQEYTFQANFGNTGAATLAVSALGNVAILREGGGPLKNGDISSGDVVKVVYTGSSFELLSPSPLFVASNTIANFPNVVAAPGNVDTIVTHGLGKVPKMITISAKVQASTGTAGAGITQGQATYTSASSDPVQIFATGANAIGLPLCYTGATAFWAEGGGAANDVLTLQVLNIGATTFTFRIAVSLVNGSPADGTVTDISWVALG